MADKPRRPFGHTDYGSKKPTKPAAEKSAQPPKPADRPSGPKPTEGAKPTDDQSRLGGTPLGGTPLGGTPLGGTPLGGTPRRRVEPPRPKFVGSTGRRAEKSNDGQSSRTDRGEGDAAPRRAGRRSEGRPDGDRRDKPYRSDDRRFDSRREGKPSRRSDDRRDGDRSPRYDKRRDEDRPRRFENRRDNESYHSDNRREGDSYRSDDRSPRYDKRRDNERPRRSENRSDERKPFRRDDRSDRFDKTYRRDYDRRSGDDRSAGGREGKPFRRQEEGKGKPFRDERSGKPYRRDQGGDRPFRRDGGRRSDGDKPFRQGQKPFRRDDDRRPPQSDKPRRWSERSEEPPRKSFGRRVRNTPIEPPTYELNTRDNRRSNKSETIRLNRFIALSGVCSRREADELIAAGRVKVDGQRVTEMGTQVLPSANVQVDGQQLRREKFVYVLLNKPKDYITTTSDPEGRRTVMDLVANACQERIYPVGRLDRLTTGLLLFTNDGELATRLSHPSYNARKVYQVELDRGIAPADFEALLTGITLEDGPAQVDRLEMLAPTADVLGLEIHSGRNRIVRRLFEHLGYDVKKLDRTAYAGLTKKNLARGHWRFLSQKEVVRLKHYQRGQQG